MKRLLNFENGKNTVDVITIELLEVVEGIEQLVIKDKDIVGNSIVYEDNVELVLSIPVYDLDNIEVGFIKISYWSLEYTEKRVIELVKGFLDKCGSIKEHYDGLQPNN
nr:hypothetical protein [uncultured Sphingobacterium sp.]